MTKYATESDIYGLDLFHEYKSPLIKGIRRRNSSAYMHSRFLKLDRRGKEVAEIGSGMVHMAQVLRQEGNGIDEETVLEGFESTGLFEKCHKNIDITCDAKSKYRTYDGSCNNLRVPAYGKSFTPLQRIFENDYDDKLQMPRTRSRKTGSKLPSAREISKVTTNNRTNLHPFLTALIVPFGQFIDHDLDFVPLIGKNLFHYYT